MKKFFTYFFIFLGVIFFVLILFSIYFWITDPYNLKPIIFGTDSSELSVDLSNQEDKNPLLTPSQEQTLEAIGVDPADVPSEITSAQEECFLAKFGEVRVAEIVSGATPTAAEFFLAKDCF